MRPPIATALAVAAGFALVVTAGTPDPELRTLTRDLGADRAAERDAAAERLLALGPAATEALVDTVERGSPAARRRARALLALLEDGDERPDARRREADAVVQAALRQDGFVRENGLHDRRLAELGDEGALAVARAVEREAARGFVRPETGATVARHPSTASLTTLTGALVADRLLGSTLVEVARAVRSDHSARLSDAAREGLRQILERPEDPRRRGAVALLARFDEETAPSFAADPDPGVRVEAARALGRGRSAAAGELLETLARDRDAAVRRAALEALREIPGRPRPEPAHENADHPDSGVRRAAAELLARDAVPASMPVLQRLASDRSSGVRAAAERALTTIRRSAAR